MHLGLACLLACWPESLPARPLPSSLSSSFGTLHTSARSLTDLPRWSAGSEITHLPRGTPKLNLHRSPALPPTPKRKWQTKGGSTSQQAAPLDTEVVLLPLPLPLPMQMPATTAAVAVAVAVVTAPSTRSAEGRSKAGSTGSHTLPSLTLRLLCCSRSGYPRPSPLIHQHGGVATSPHSSATVGTMPLAAEEACLRQRRRQRRRPRVEPPSPPPLRTPPMTDRPRRQSRRPTRESWRPRRD